MKRIYINSQGWVCERHPYNLPIDGTCSYIDTDDETYLKTMVAKTHYAWRVVNNQLVEEKYEQETTEEVELKELETLLAWFKEYDTQVMQYIRCQRTGNAYDKDIALLDMQAIVNSKRVSQLKAKYKI